MGRHTSHPFLVHDTKYIENRSGTLYPVTYRHLSAKLALTSPTSGGLAVGIVRSRTQATKLQCCRTDVNVTTIFRNSHDMNLEWPHWQTNHAVLCMLWLHVDRNYPCNEKHRPDLCYRTKENSVAWVCERTIPTEPDHSTFFYVTYINSVRISQEVQYIFVVQSRTLTTRPQRRSTFFYIIYIYI
jgi:hypothetical protein